MPMYHYECPNCGNQVQVIQRLSDKSLTKCEKCHKRSLKKVPSTASFKLRGRGFHCNDYPTSPFK